MIGEITSAQKYEIFRRAAEQHAIQLATIEAHLVSLNASKPTEQIAAAIARLTADAEDHTAAINALQKTAPDLPPPGVQRAESDVISTA